MNLKKIRIKKGLSQNELAKITGIKQGYISALESGSRSPGVRILLKLSEALECTTDELIKDGE